MPPNPVHRTSARPTMAEVAAEAHVSVKTVSRVLKREAGVRPETQAKVRAVIERIGFVRAESSAHLLAARTHTIGLVIEDLANPFYAQIAAAVEREARLRHHQLVTASAEGSPSRERAVVDLLRRSRVDGLVVIPAGTTLAAAESDVYAAIPTVFVDRPVQGGPHDTVLSDNAGGVRSALEHLVAHGHRRIGFLGDDPEFWTARQRREAFLQTHDILGLPASAPVSMGPHDVATTSAALRAWCTPRRGVTAVLTGNNRITVAALHAIREVGLSVGVVGYDDFELATLLDPAITVVHQDPTAMGQRAAAQLIGRLLGDESAPTTTVMPTRLIVRESSRLPR